MDDMSQVRAVIENITPQVDDGRFAIKRTSGEFVVVEADVFADGHDLVTALLLYRHEGSSEWLSVSMAPIGNDRWRGRFEVQQLGRYLYTVSGWVDRLGSWRQGLAKKFAAGEDLELDLQHGAALILEHAKRAPDADAEALREWAKGLTDLRQEASARVSQSQSAAMHQLQQRYPDPAIIARWEPPFPADVDREKARFSSWYEMFPRSAASDPTRHGTFADVEKLLPYIADMGFDVLYLPPIHPIGAAQRKGPNNRWLAGDNDPGSPWAIGGSAGGHLAIHPQLGTLSDFKHLVARANERGIEVAIDIALQTSPDHPYVREHPEWFAHRPDGSIQYAENPPKKYQDIYPFHFESVAARALWSELRGIFDFWLSQGIRIFRVDNPHTKPFGFWEELIRTIRKERPDVIFLAEAFTRPKVMYRLAKLGFTQSYNYFPWRNTKRELVEYFTELARAPVSDFFRANLWPNTPDILPEYLQISGRSGFMVRLVLAATLGASYGIYGPAFELMESQPREPDSEEYLDSEKYQLRHWNRDDPASLREFIGRINRIRGDNAPLQSDRNLTFHDVDNDSLIAYSKTDPQGDAVLIVVNVDPHHARAGWLQLNLSCLALPPTGSFQMHDLLSGARFLWEGPRNYVSLDPAHSPAHIFRIRRHARSEKDFDYFL